jgi:hypothetical protein
MNWNGVDLATALIIGKCLLSFLTFALCLARLTHFLNTTCLRLLLFEDLFSLPMPALFIAARCYKIGMKCWSERPSTNTYPANNTMYVDRLPLSRQSASAESFHVTVGEEKGGKQDCICM